MRFFAEPGRCASAALSAEHVLQLQKPAESTVRSLALAAAASVTSISSSVRERE
jgi:hypothetical protein